MAPPEDSAPSTAAPTDEQASTEPAPASHPDLGTARTFLQDPQVKLATRKEKVEFLKSKGLKEDDIETLLKEEDATPISPKPDSISEIEPPTLAATPHVAEASPDALPPIVTYPEFLAKPQRPPPLVTVNGVLNTVCGFAGLTAFLYGASKYVVEPMVESLTDARTILHETTAHNLSTLIEKLENTVSEIPVTASARKSASDDGSDIDDPTELFHRDIGTQTTTELNSPVLAGRESLEQPSILQARKLSRLVDDVRAIKDGFVTESEDLEDIKTVIDVFRGDLEHLTYPNTHDFSTNNYSIYGSSRRNNEPDDEIKRAKENIRRVKGVFLSTRNFPTSAR